MHNHLYRFGDQLFKQNASSEEELLQYLKRSGNQGYYLCDGDYWILEGLIIKKQAKKCTCGKAAYAL